MTGRPCRPVVVHHALAVGEDAVQPAAGVDQDLDGLAALLLRALGHDLPHGAHDLADLGLEAGALRGPLAAPGLERRPDGGQLVGVLGDVRLALGGQPQAAAPALVVDLDQALVLELLDGRVDRARARPPGAAAALGDLLDDLVAVDRLALGAARGGEHVEDGAAHVAAADLGAALVAGGHPEEAGQPRRRSAVPAVPVPAGGAARAAGPRGSPGPGPARPAEGTAEPAAEPPNPRCDIWCSLARGASVADCRRPLAIYRHTKPCGRSHPRGSGQDLRSFRGGYQPRVPGSPLNGPSTRSVTQPP